jgi:hypothetical protein
MSRVPRTRLAARLRRLPGRWLVVALVAAAALALLVPGVSYATAGQSNAADTGCLGVTPAAFPAMGFITNPDRHQAGHLWWRRTADGGVCIGTVVEWVQYNAPMTKTWTVTVYTAAHPNGLTVKARTFALSQGWYFWSFGVHQVFSGLTSVCITASDSFGVSCIDFGPAQG